MVPLDDWGPQSIKTALRDIVLRRRRPHPAVDDFSAHDLYLAPHFDDICFSLGALVAHRRQGTLLTLFSNSNYVARPDELQVLAGKRTETISALRRAEDAAFAAAVGLRLVVGGLDEAPLRGRGPFDTDKSLEDAIRLEPGVMRAIADAGRERPGGHRPWLYCPMAIGGHLDHMALLRIVRKNYDALRASYRIAFYEDLHYASVWQARVAGLIRFQALIAPLKPRRSRYPISPVRDKIARASLYESQFVEPPSSIVQFTPAQFLAAPPHEAVWTAEQP